MCHLVVRPGVLRVVTGGSAVLHGLLLHQTSPSAFASLAIQVFALGAVVLTVLLVLAVVFDT